jgi:hypothetical protein
MAAPAGVVTSLEASSLETQFDFVLVGLLPLVVSVGGEVFVAGQATWGCIPLTKTSALSSVVESHHLVAVRLLAAFHGAWCCLAFQRGVGQRRGTTLAAMSTGGD